MTFAARVVAFHDGQQAAWTMLRDSVAALAGTRTRPLPLAGGRVVLQLNPGRAVNATAVRRTPCVLCPDERPPGQGALPLDEAWDLLCNPYPLLPRHAVLATRHHAPQRLAPALPALLALAERLGPAWLAFYNGPGCGASVPQHLHVQAGLAAGLPLIDDLATWPRCRLAPGVEALDGYRVPALVGAVRSPDDAAGWLDALRTRLPRVDGEPMLNLAVRHDGDEATLIAFPRTRHRPTSWPAPGQPGFRVSPGAVEMAGLVPLSTPHDFEAMTAADLEAIYADVTPAPAAGGRLL